ncbi:Phosphoglycerol transferase MdoB [Desulfobacula phenolica]|uniref:Phosphoglycerol transferase MdoB n=2 Tax=Desulfobacula phenolica TaxID=90732 RepID=A0A1H2GQ54_9BACT|nr:Phosphoglycerol transferase MdoB [Desulfobacula phenolica]
MKILTNILKFYLFIITVFFIGRMFLFIQYFKRFSEIETNYWLTFLYGLKMDTIVACMIIVIPMLLFTLMPKSLGKKVDFFLKGYILIMISLCIFIEYATFPFFAQYDVRPNYLFVEYLIYPKEVFGMIMGDYKLIVMVGILLITGFIYLFANYIKFNFNQIYKITYAKRALLFLPLALVLFIGIRSSLGHRPANLSDAMYSSNRIINEITKNSIYSICYSIYSDKKYEADVSKLYGKMNIEEALNRFKNNLNIQSLDKKTPLHRKVKTNFKTDSSKNLVIFIQESMGYQFVESTGGEKGITPNLNLLSKKGLLFTNVFSNGTRSIRGIAGCVSGIFSTPGKGVVKKNKSQTGFFTISSLLEPFGYHTLFLYGGESRFDNMRGWFLGNGFDQIIDEPKFKNPEFIGTWGVSDGDLINRANEEFIKLDKKKQKFAAILFSTSNHTPFDFPKEKIDLINGIPEKSVKNAIKYADFAIGEFIKKARQESYYKNTVFVIIADHNVRVYGDDMVPVNMFHIPALILGEGIKPEVYSGLSTQPDVLATALDLLGLDLTYPIMGHSIFSNKKQALSFMQFNQTYALRINDRVAVVRPKKEPLTFLYEKQHLKPVDHDMELEKNALAFIVSLNYIYNKQLYK